MERGWPIAAPETAPFCPGAAPWPISGASCRTAVRYGNYQRYQRQSCCPRKAFVLFKPHLAQSTRGFSSFILPSSCLHLHCTEYLCPSCVHLFLVPPASSLLCIVVVCKYTRCVLRFVAVAFCTNLAGDRHFIRFLPPPFLTSCCSCCSRCSCCSCALALLRPCALVLWCPCCQPR